MLQPPAVSPLKGCREVEGWGGGLPKNKTDYIVDWTGVRVEVYIVDSTSVRVEV